MRFANFANQLKIHLKRTTLACLTSLIVTPLFAWPSESPWVKGRAKTSEVRLLTSNAPLEKRQLFGVEFKLQSDWHIYWKNPGDTGYAPKLTWKLPEGWKAEEILFPTPTRKFTESLGVINGYSKSVIFPVYLETTAAPEATIKVDIDYLVCDVQCVPEKVSLQLNLVGADKKHTSSKNEALLDALTKIPGAGAATIKRKSENQFYFSFLQEEKITDLFINSSQKIRGLKIDRLSENEFEVSTSQPLSSFEWVASIPNKPGISGAYPLGGSEEPGMNLWIALLFAFLGGLILNLMPCVLPVLMLKSVSLMKYGSASIREIRSSLFMTIIGILTSFAVLAVVFLALQNAGRQVGWGFHFQSPLFVVLMALLIFLFALNLFDLFQFHLGSKAAGRMSTSAQGPFLEGVFATLLATPCSAPFLGTALTFAFSQSQIILVLMLFTMGLGLSTPYWLLMVTPQALKVFPKPGLWMETMKRVLGYVLLLTTLWLLYILQQQMGSIALILTLGVFILIFVCLRELKSPWKWILSVFVAASLFVGMDRLHTAQADAASSSMPFSATTLQERLDSGEVLYVVVTADWCLTCKYNENFVMRTQWFKSLVEEKGVVEIVYDWTNRDDEIGKFLASYNRVGIPFSMLISKNKTLLFPELLTRENVEENFKKFFGN